MDTTNRREFIRNSSLVAGALTIPDWIARAFGLQDPKEKSEKQAKEPSREEQAKAAWRRARATGKPLLIFVVPVDQSKCYTRGAQLGALLNHGGDRMRLDLAVCEPVCATLAEIQRVVKFKKFEGEPLMLLIESDKVVVTRIDPDMKISGEGETELDRLIADWKKLDAHAKIQKDRIVAALHAAVVPDRARLVERADLVRQTLAEDERAALESYFAGGVVPADALLVRAAAVILMAAAAPRKAGESERMRKALAKAAQALLIKRRIPGAKWAHSTGCGSRIEGDKTGGMMIACGMGHVPKISERFLYFFTD